MDRFISSSIKTHIFAILKKSGYFRIIDLFLVLANLLDSNDLQHPFDSNLLEPTLLKRLLEQTQKMEITMRHPTIFNKQNTKKFVFTLPS
jgi:hypothetical protein